jgi:D-3-phosphoglycerate dehydrogenase
MKVLICDYPESMMPDHSLEIETLKRGLGDGLEVVVHPYDDSERGEFLELLSDADALLTAFVPMDEEAFAHAPNLKVIAINATGYDNVDLGAATRHGVGVCPIGEYCTWDVSESAIAYMFALNKHLKFYTRQIEDEHVWDFAAAPEYPRMQDQTLGIVGFGKIGRCTARKASSLVKRVIAYDPYVADEEFGRLGVERVTDRDELFASADIIVNHMCLTDSNRFFFDADAFSKMRRNPILINLGRGLAVDERALVKALDDGTIRAFGADVLYDETPDLANHPLVGRDNVIITPHSAFYSTASMRDVQVIPCQNIAHFINGERNQLFKLVNDVPVGAGACELA